MARKTTPPKAVKKPKPITPEASKEEQIPRLEVEGVDSTELVEQLNTWIGGSDSHWKGKDYKLDKVDKENEKLYLGRQVSDDDDGSDENLSLDNRIFSSIRTIVPYVTKRITQPEVYPSSNSDAAKKFAEDFEKVLHKKAELEKLKPKIKFALEDAIIRRRGYLKPRYDAATGNFCKIEYVPAESIIIDHNAKPYEEPRYFRQPLKKSVDDLLAMFPGMAKEIKSAFKIDQNSPRTKYTELHTINEDWAFMPIEGKMELLVCWNYNKQPLGVIKDPNWRDDLPNFLPHHMMPLIFLNVLNDGRSHIDKTSYVEQAKYSQMTIDKRGRQISKNAGLGSVGMPVVDVEAISDEQSQYLQYEEDTVLVLEVPEGKTIHDVFDKWQASPLSSEVYQDKEAAIEAVNNAFGASTINQGGESDNKTLGQDVLLRDQSQGRQQDIVDAIDNAMERLYLFIAQFMLVYGNEEELFKLVGENGQFDYIIMNTESLDTNAEIQVKSGTSMPIDNAQRRATADAASQRAMIDPLTYWEIMDEPNAEKYAKRVVEFTADPMALIKDADEQVFDRDAYVDIQIVKSGGQPPYREELPKQYFDYLNKFALSGATAPENPNLDQATKEALVAFINQQLVRGQQMLGIAETQLPTPEDVNAYNEQTDAANQQAAEAAKTSADQTKPQGVPVV